MSASVDRTASQPQRAGLVLTALILVAAVANLNLAVANVALPSIGEHFDSSQTTLDLDRGRLLARPGVLGALARRARRPLRPEDDARLVGTVLAIPASLLAAWAPSDTVLIVARVGGGLAAGMAYPTTLALITALWSRPGPDEGRSRSGRASAARSRRSGRCSSGLLLEHFWWGSVFLLTLPLAVVAIVMA